VLILRLRILLIKSYKRNDNINSNNNNKLAQVFWVIILRGGIPCIKEVTSDKEIMSAVH
jgi:hypothetical protein